MEGCHRTDQCGICDRISAGRASSGSGGSDHAGVEREGKALSESGTQSAGGAGQDIAEDLYRYGIEKLYHIFAAYLHAVG